MSLLDECLAVRSQVEALSDDQLVELAYEALDRIKAGLTPVNFIFDGPPGPNSGEHHCNFIEAETVDGRSVRTGEWTDQGDGTWALRLLVQLPVLPQSRPSPKEGPHSRACGMTQHDHGPACHRNCPTCGGRR